MSQLLTAPTQAPTFPDQGDSDQADRKREARGPGCGP
jgi:hypothetical protein